MILEIAQIEIRPGMEHEFEAGVARAKPLFERAHGCRSMELQRSQELPSRYRLLVRWDTVEDHTVTFRGSPEFLEWRKLVGHCFATPPSVEHTRQVWFGFDHSASGSGAGAARRPPDFASFSAAARAEDYDEVLERKWAPSTVLDTHTHPFEVKALVVAGEMWLTVGDHVRHLRPGDEFALEDGVPHAERYGAEGATYWVARRYSPPPGA